mgnify:FL=1
MGGDPRIGDAMDDVKDADYATLNMDPLRYFYKKEEMKLPNSRKKRSGLVNILLKLVYGLGER